MSIIKKFLNFLGLLEPLREYRKKSRIKYRLKGEYRFENRKQDLKKMCIILAGYKPFLYEIIFKRIKSFVPKDIDICIVSSGKYDEQLSNIAKKNNWSYLSVKRNCVSLVQNIAISLFDKAEYIYKLDEDIFVTKNYFEILLKTYKDCEKNGEYNVGFVAPTIPINGYGNMTILERFNCKDYYTKHFEKPKYAAGSDRKVESDPNVAQFFWGKDEILPQLDKMNEQMNKDKFTYSACPIRFSIGAILFKRSTWEDFGMFEVNEGNCMGYDEEQICNYCMSKSRAIIVSNNSVVGHLSFGTQNQTMKNYFEENKKLFDINK